VPAPSDPPVRGLFRRQVAGDDALLRLAALRFEQAGMPAELYAETPDDLDHVLGFVPEHAALPTVHLSRGLDLLDPAHREVVQGFVTRFAGRVAGFVVHDRPGMAARLLPVVTALRQVGGRDDGPYVWLEYAAGAPLEWFTEVAARIARLGRAGLCLDTGHVGLAVAHAELRRPPAVTGPLSTRDGTLAAAVDRVQAATAAALPALLGSVRDVGATGTAVHLHLHDGHPAVPDLSDHLSFLFRLPVPFRYGSVSALDPMYGPGGLAAILAAAVRGVRPERLTLTLEVHQAEGRLPLAGGARALFRHWSDPTNAERFNHWLSVVADNHLLATTALAALAPDPDPDPDPAGLPVPDATSTLSG